MARFTCKEKWSDKWFRALEPREKLLWLYILDNCDNAGFFELDSEMCAFFTKMPQDHIEGAIEGLGRGLIGSKIEGLYYVRNFLKHQKNLPLNPENNAHKQIIRLLSDKQVNFEDNLAPNQPLIRGTGKGKGKGSSRGKVEYTPEFNEWWKVYKKGNKSTAFDAWKKGATPENIIALSEKYMAYCASADRPMLDGQGFLNQKAYDTDWTHDAQGTKGATPSKEPEPDFTEYGNHDQD